jgi:hypothetical protein
MPRFIPKTTNDDEPLNSDVYLWSDWALERIREALAAGEEPPVFRQHSPWHWIYLSTVVNKAGLRDRVFVDSLQKRVEWEPPDGDDAA